jgi:hypothetical protein
MHHRQNPLESTFLNAFLMLRACWVDLLFVHDLLTVDMFTFRRYLSLYDNRIPLLAIIILCNKYAQFMIKSALSGSISLHLIE